MNITLVQPSSCGKSFFAFRYPPMGLLALGTFLMNKGHTVSLIDAYIDQFTSRDVISMITNRQPDVVGVSSMSGNSNEAFEIARGIKSQNPDVKVIAGGVHPTVMPEHVLRNGNIDVVVMGEGEITTSTLLDAFTSGGNLRDIEGIAFRNGSEIIINKRRALIQDLDSLPIPRYSLLDMRKYRGPLTKRGPFAGMVRSRGCVFECAFCCSPALFGRTFRVQTPSRTLAEIDYLVKEFNVKEIAFKDTELTLDPRLTEVCDLLIERDYDLIWSCNGRVSNADVTLFRKIKRAGCYSVTFGIESGSEIVLEWLKKDITCEQARQGVKAAQDAGLQVVTNFMIGNPHDTQETIEQTIRFAIELDGDFAYFGFTTPYPGTELYRHAMQNNWMLDNHGDATHYGTCMMNATAVTTEELKAYLKRAYWSFYFRPRFITKRLLRAGLLQILNNSNELKAVMRTLS